MGLITQMGLITIWLFYFLEYTMMFLRWNYIQISWQPDPARKQLQCAHSLPIERGCDMSELSLVGTGSTVPLGRFRFGAWSPACLHLMSKRWIRPRVSQWTGHLMWKTMPITWGPLWLPRTWGNPVHPRQPLQVSRFDPACILFIFCGVVACSSPISLPFCSASFHFPMCCSKDVLAFNV